MIFKQSLRIEDPVHLAGTNTTAHFINFQTGNTQKNEIPKNIPFAEISFRVQFCALSNPG